MLALRYVVVSSALLTKMIADGGRVASKFYISNLNEINCCNNLTCLRVLEIIDRLNDSSILNISLKN